MTRLDYWKECLLESFSQNGITASIQQLDAVTADIAVSHENHSLAFHVPESSLIGEVRKLKNELETEKRKQICNHCRGSGRVVMNGPIHSSNSECIYCHGDGKK